MKIISVVGARPNFMKIAPIHKAIQNHNAQYPASAVHHQVCHTGQHYDEKMSKIFFKDLGLPEPDFYLGVGSGSHTEQTAKTMLEFEKVLLKEKPDLIIVVGDVNSTVACSLVASKLNIKIAHVEAGLRSYDRTMPEEINRILTDSISDFLFVTEQSGVNNLIKEGVSPEKIFFVGNVMIDSLVHNIPKSINSDIFSTLGLLNKKQVQPFVLITLHRPSNVDSKEYMNEFFEMLVRISEQRKIIFPLHPRTKKNLSENGLLENLNEQIILTDPIGYVDFLALTRNAELIITDSGGIQEESTFLGIQCITVRNNTERPITVEVGTNQLIGTDLKKVEQTALDIFNGKVKYGKIPKLWDGKASERIIEILVQKDLSIEVLQPKLSFSK